ncbi:MAG: LysE family transporter [Clostridia bacterium]|nr:LysE family transporter [Clostridia bacterium]
MNYAPMLVYVLVACITPGPNNIMCMYLGANYGFKGTRKFMIASSISFMVKMLLCGGLNLALAEVIPAAVPYVKWIGAAYMLYLALHMLHEGFRAQPEEDDDGIAGGESTYKSGILLQCLNIKSWIFALSLFSIYVVPYDTTFRAVLIGTGIATAAMIASTLLWAAFGSAIRGIYRRHIRFFSVLMAASLVWCAVTAVM